MSTPTVSNQETYTNGPFTIKESIINEDGRQWMQLELILTSGPVRIPFHQDEHRAHAVRRAEVLALTSIGQALIDARRANDEPDTNQD